MTNRTVRAVGRSRTLAIALAEGARVSSDNPLAPFVPRGGHDGRRTIGAAIRRLPAALRRPGRATRPDASRGRHHAGSARVSRQTRGAAEAGHCERRAGCAASTAGLPIPISWRRTRRSTLVDVTIGSRSGWIIVVAKRERHRRLPLNGGARSSARHRSRGLGRLRVPRQARAVHHAWDPPPAPAVGPPRKRAVLY